MPLLYAICSDCKEKMAGTKGIESKAVEDKIKKNVRKFIENLVTA